MAFLRSDEGGAWQDHEIETFETPRLVYGQQGAAQVDFQLTYFTGHGYSDGRRPFVCLNDDQFVPVGDLPQLARKSLVIIDACRDEIQDGYPLLEKRADFGAVAGIEDMMHRARCRWMYDAAIERADGGVTTLFASSYNESAWGSSRLGGDFTRHLVQAAEAWASVPRMRSQAAEILYVNWAFYKALNRLDGTGQTPNGFTQQGARQLPFAVRSAR